MIEKRRQTGPGRARMLKPGAFGALTVFIPAWRRRREKSSRDNGLIRGMRSGSCQSDETSRNSANAITPHGGLLVTSHCPLSASVKLDSASIEWVVDRHKGGNFSDCVRATPQQQLFNNHTSDKKPVSHHRSKKDKSWKGQYTMFEHLCLKHWPFVVVPEPAFCTFIADREQFRKDISTLLRNLSRQNSSSIHPIWSWFGAGKTHTLYYLANCAAKIHKQGSCHLRTIYSEFPRSPRSFVDVYKSFALRLEQEVLSEAYLEICTSSDAGRLERDLLSASTDLVSALKVLAIGGASDQNLAMRWIRAEALPVAECRKLGISKKIASSEESSRTLIGLVRMFGLSASSQNKINHRLIWSLDELQRIEQLPPRVRNEINTGLHSTFNACPTGFTMLLSFSGRPTDTLPVWFSPELKDRIGRTKVMVLPPMQTEDALLFVKDVLAHSRRSEDVGIDPYFPFEESACRIIIEDIQKNDELKPRAIMQTFNAVLQEADSQIETDELQVISPTFARQVLNELVRLE